MVQVDRNAEMVDQDKGGGRLNRSTKGLSLSFSFYDIDDVAVSRNDDNTKLTRVVSDRILR
ncbi:MAG: hypothetical protein ACR2IS_20360 [Nitrososphaeraceae archaeon]